jgi:regulator of protease activity HflC (stomatin/prohibitin superfamily)
MDAALGWIGQLIEWFGMFIPRRIIIETTHAGVKWVKGHTVVPLNPGIHFYWPLLTEYKTYPTARQATDLRTQTLMTTDGKTIVVGGMIVYEIKDIEAILAHTYDPEQTIKDVTLSAIHDVLVKMSSIEIRTETELGRLSLRLRRRVRKELAQYGVKVLKVALTDFAFTKVYKLIQSTSQEGL